LFENADRTDNRRLDGTIHAYVDMGVYPCPVASSGASIGRQAQIQQEQQQEQQQMRLAQHSLVTSDCRGET
jgi:hypothetical protein